MKTSIFQLLNKALNTIKYNGVYIFLAIIFPLILFVFDAGKEIIQSLSEVKSQLNLSLCLVAFFMLGFSIWCIPTLAITIFQFFTGYKGGNSISQDEKNEKEVHCNGERENERSPEEIKSSEELFTSLVAIYNDEPTDGGQQGKTQFPIRWFAVFPWLMFLFTYYWIANGIRSLIAEAIVIIVLFVAGNFLYKKYSEKILAPEKPIAFLLKCTLPFLVLLMIPYFLGNSCLGKYHLYTYGFIAPLSIVIFYYTLCLLEEQKPRYKLSEFNYNCLLTVLMLAIITFYVLNNYQQLPNISPVVVLIIMAALLITFFDLFITAQYLLVKIAKSNYRDKNKDVIYFRIGAYQLFILILPVAAIALTLFSSLNSHRIRKVFEPGRYVSINQRTTLTDYFDAWYKNDSALISKGSTIYLISGQGGGSRAAAWFFMNMANREKQDPDFFRKVFSISTVSGSSVGAYMFLGAKYFNADINHIDTVAINLFAKNYMSSAFYGLLLGDGIDGVWNRIVSSGANFPKDRNYYLQKEEMAAFKNAFDNIHDSVAGYFEADYMQMYRNPQKTPPLFFINTAIVEKGTRGVFSPVQLEGISLARDLYREFKIDDHNGGYNIPMTTCVNQSQAFPLLSAYNYMDRVGRFIDGGLYENTGCATTLEVYQALRQYLNSSGRSNLKIVLYNLTTSNMTEDYTAPYKNASILNSLTAIVNTPFGGHQNFAYNNLRRQVTYLNGFGGIAGSDTVKNIPLNESITLTRCLSDSSVKKLYSSVQKVSW